MILLRNRRVLAVLACVPLSVVMTATASADWLVTRDGARIETRDAWEVKGRQVVFTLPNGTLSSLRLDDVDLEASASATAEALQPPPAPPPPAEEQKPVMVLTNEDVTVRPGGTAGGAVPSAGGDTDADGVVNAVGEATIATDAAGADAILGDVELQLLTWNAQPSDKVGGLEIVGTVRNVGTDPAAKVEVHVTIPGEDDEILFETTAFVRSAVLSPGRHTNFRALLPNIYQLTSDPIFSFRATGYALGSKKPKTDP